MKNRRPYQLLALICLLVTSCGGGGGQSGAADQAAPKIINGTETSQSDLPQYVKVFKQVDDGSWGACTGTMISGRAVLTAGHCVSGARTVAVQTDGSDGPVYYAENVYVGEGYGSDPLNPTVSDIAVIITQTPTGRPALALLASRVPQPGEEIAVIGFGVEDGVEGTFGTLRSGTMTVADASETHIIVQYDGEGSNVCFGDSGGPAVYFVKDDAGNVIAAGIAGVVSAGTDAACAEGDITYYTSVQPFLDGILAIVPDAGLI